MGPVAQVVEQLTFNQWVEGSNPSGLTIFPKKSKSIAWSDYQTVLCRVMIDNRRASPTLAGEALSLADVVLACEMALLSNEGRMGEQLADKGLPPLLAQLRDYPRLFAHLQSLYARPEFAADLADYAHYVGVAA